MHASKKTPVKPKAKPAPAAPAPGTAAEPESIIEVQISSFGIDTDMLTPGCEVPMLVRISNTGFDDVNEAMQILLEANDYFAKSMAKVPVPLESGADIDVLFVLKPAGGHSNLEALPEWLEIKLRTRSKVLHTVKAQIPIDLFITGLRRQHKKRRFLLFGKMGTGKSSFTNSVATAFDTNPLTRGEVRKICHTAQSEESVTRKAEAFEVDIFTLIDTFGWETAKDNYNASLFEALLAGRVKLPFRIKDAADFGLENIVDSTAAQPVDNVIFAITLLAAEDKAYLNKLREFIAIATDKFNLLPIILLTQIDLADESLIENPYATHPKILELKEQVSAITRIDMGDIIPVINYCAEKKSQRTWQLDRAAYVAIHKACVKSMDAENRKNKTVNN